MQKVFSYEVNTLLILVTQPEMGVGGSILLRGKHITDISYLPYSQPNQRWGWGEAFSYEVNTSLILVISLTPNPTRGGGGGKYSPTR